jgi:hypothetical protein
MYIFINRLTHENWDMSQNIDVASVCRLYLKRLWYGEYQENTRKHVTL